MKPHLVRLVLGLAGLALAGAALPALLRAQAPDSPAPAPAADAAGPKFINPTTPQELEIQGLGERAIDKLTVSLVNEVKSALAGCEPEDAVDMCHLKALSPTNPVRSMPRITGVKFTSLKIRQPDNAPDLAEKQALDYIDHIMQSGDALPKVLVQKLATPDGAATYRVYKPIGLTNNCLVCHGDPADQSPKLRARLKAIYPDDQATGYRARAWRGLVRVNVAEAVPTE